MAEEEKADEETHFDRRKKYRELVAGGMTDRNATETVWPTKLGMEKKAKDKAEKEKKEE